MEKEKLRVGVIFGGLSAEKEVSLTSGRNVCQTLDKTLFLAVPIFLDKEAKFWKIPESLVIRNTCKEIEENLEAKGAARIPYESLGERIDFAFLATHGKYGDDGCLQGLLELLNIPYTGSGVLSAAIGMDKPMQRKLMSTSEENVNFPDYAVARIEEWNRNPDSLVETLEKKFGYPMVVKPTREGSTNGVRKVEKKEDFPAAMEQAFIFDNAALIEPFLNGREFSCVVVGNASTRLSAGSEPQAFLPTETKHEGDIFTYDHKYLPGASEKITPMETEKSVIEEIRRQATAAYKALECKTFARIDGFVLDGGRVLVTDPNSGASTGLGPSSWTFHQAALAGFPPKEFLTKLVEFALEAHAQKKGCL